MNQTLSGKLGAVHNDLLNVEFSATIQSSETVTRKINSYQDFFLIDNFEAKFFKKISITLSYLIKFNRPDTDAAPEKQIVNFRFESGRIGLGTIEVRSTEFSWPSSIFDTITTEFNSLHDEVVVKNPPSSQKLISIHKYFKGFNLDIAFKSIALSASLLFIFSFFYLNVSESRQPDQLTEIYIYNEETASFDETQLNQILESDNWQEKLSEIRDSEFLRKLMPVAKKADDSNFSTIIAGLKAIPVAFWFGTLAIFVIGYLNIREARRLKSNYIGRIWLSNSTPPDRKKLPSSEGVVESIFLSVLGAAALAAILHYSGLLLSLGS